MPGCQAAHRPVGMIRERVSLTKAEFLEELKRDAGAVPPLYLRIPYASPHELYPAFSGRGSILFESVKGPETIARHSFITFEPYACLLVKDGLMEIEWGGKRAISSKKDPLRRFSEIVGAYRQKPAPGLPPFQGGAAGLFCYDFARYLEAFPDESFCPPDELGLPEACFFMADRMLAFDHVQREAWGVVCPGARRPAFAFGYADQAGQSADWPAEYDEALEALERIFERATGARPEGAAGPLIGGEIDIEHEMTERQYTEMVGRAKEYIAAGDIFQANLSLRVRARIGQADPWGVYCLLRGINPSPFAAFMDFGDFHIAGSSPERLVKLGGGVVETRPIAGTRPRGKDAQEDLALRAELLLNEKEKAEHIMLIDLERNDIGRVARYGSVEVNEFMTTEDYSHVMHIVSNVRGRLADGKGMFDCLRATFPGGTITGVPKVRCMEIINELEPARRGPYTGSAGYFGFSGAMDMNIIIRTFLIKEGTAYVQAGAGIVADSVAGREYRESLKKAEALLLALKLAGQKRNGRKTGRARQ